MTTEYRWKTYALRLLDIVRNRMLVKINAGWRQRSFEDVFLCPWSSDGRCLEDAFMKMDRRPRSRATLSHPPSERTMKTKLYFWKWIKSEPPLTWLQQCIKSYLWLKWQQQCINGNPPLKRQPCGGRGQYQVQGKRWRPRGIQPTLGGNRPKNKSVMKNLVFDNSYVLFKWQEIVFLLKLKQAAASSQGVPDQDVPHLR